MLYSLVLAACCATGLASANLYTRDASLPAGQVYRRALADSLLRARTLTLRSNGPRRAQSPMQRGQNIPSEARSGGSIRPSSPQPPSRQQPQLSPGQHSNSPPRVASPPQQQQIQSPMVPPLAPPRPPRPASPVVAAPIPMRQPSTGPVEYEAGQLPSNHHEGNSAPQSRAASPGRPLERASRSEDNQATRSRVQAAMLGRESLYSQLRFPANGLPNANIIGAIRGPVKIRAAGKRGQAEHWKLQPGESAFIGPGFNPTTSVKARVLPHSHVRGEVALVAGAHKAAEVKVTTMAGGTGSLHFKKPEHLAYSQPLLDEQTGTAAGEVAHPPGEIVVAGDLKGPGKITAKAEDFDGLRRTTTGLFYKR